MNEPEFTFECKSLDLDEIERILCEHYDLGIPKSLGSPPLTLTEGNALLEFSAENGKISCMLYKYKSPGTELFTVEISKVKIIKFAHE